MLTILPILTKFDFNSDDEFKAYMKKRRVQIYNKEWRENHPYIKK